jgi:ABC-2 type transport system permease protein
VLSVTASRLRRLLSRESARLLVELTRAAFRVADHDSLLGALWSLISPFVMLVALWLVFHHRFGAELPAYPLYLLIGISLVNYFVTATRFLIGVLNNHRALLLNTTVPREMVIASQLAVHTWKLAVEMALCALLSACYGLFSPLASLAVLPLLAAYVAFTAGIGLVLALIHCFARDIEHIWSLSSRLLLFITPVFYGLGGLSPGVRFAVVWLNPLTPFLTGVRAALIGSAVSPLEYAWALVLGGSALAVGAAAFLALENAALERA